MDLHPPAPSEEASFDLTPMIDVVLLLIIFFMLTSQFNRAEQAPIDLPPEEGDGAPEQGDKSIILDLSRTGRLSVRGDEQIPEDLALRLASEAAARGESPDTIDILLRADESAPARELARVCAALASAGIRSVRLATDADRAADRSGE